MRRLDEVKDARDEIPTWIASPDHVADKTHEETSDDDMTDVETDEEASFRAPPTGKPRPKVQEGQGNAVAM